MKNSTPFSLQAFIGALAIYTISAASQGAVYVKLQGVPGDAKAKPAETEQIIKQPGRPQAVALLLPAVQQVREAAYSPETYSRGGKPDTNTALGDEHEIEYDIAR